MNVELLRRISKQISDEPRRLDMNVLLEKVDGKDKTNPPCGTVGCIAGWACILSGAEVENGKIWGAASSLLDLTTDEADRLFTEPEAVVYGDADGEICGWPETFASDYEHSSDSKGRADITVARIEHFIATKGKE